MFNKKGVSGIVAVIFLILLVIIISGVVFNWVKDQSSDVMDKSDVISEKLQACRDFKVNFESASCNPDVEGIIKVKITNDEGEDLKEAFSVRLIGDDDIEATISSVNDIELKAYEGKEITIFKQQETNEFGTYFKPVSKIEFIPRFFIGEETIYCSDNKVSLDAEGCG